MERPRVLIMGKLPPPLMGPAIATEIILKSDLNKDFELVHFDTRINETVAEMGKWKWSKVKAVQNKYKAFKRLLEEAKPALVLVPIGQTTMGFFKDLPFIRMAAKSGAKVLIQLRGSAFKTWVDNSNPLVKSRVKGGLKNVDGAIVLGENLKYIFEDFFPSERIFVVPNGGDYSFPKRKNPKLRVTYLANYLPGKGLKELLEALAFLKKDKGLSAYEFQAYGNWDNPEYEKACRTIIAENDLKHCTLNTAVSGAEKWQALADADIFVFAPNAPEGHPWSLVEALAAGLPVITTNRGAIQQCVNHEVNGYLLENPEPRQLAAYLRILLTSDYVREDMSKASRELYLAEFTASKMTEKLGQTFTKILQA
jgi:glycosyltransferase involved in cell wall biosynthesis